MTRLATGLCKMHEVFVYSLSKPRGTDFLLRQLRDAGVRVFSGPFRGLLERMARRLGLLEWIHGKRLRNLGAQEKIEVVNGHQVQAERAACLAFVHDPVPLIGTDHGCYRALLSAVSGLGRKQDYAAVFQRSDGLVCLSQSNMEVAARHTWKQGFRTWKIYNGYHLPSVSIHPRLKKNDEGIVFGMIARGIAEKGWAEAVEAFRQTRRALGNKITLRLAGTGPGLEQLHRDYTTEQLEGVEFLGQVDDVTSVLRGIDIGLLPTWFELESLPNTVIEYLACGIPVIATPIGGIPEMLEHPGGSAGVLVPLDPSTRRADVSLLTTAMIRLATDDSHRHELSTRALEAARKFDLARTVNQYTEVFREVASRVKAASEKQKLKSRK